MAESLLECYRLDRYEFEVFIGELKSTEHQSSTCLERNSEENNVQKSEQNNEEENLVQKYTIRTMMGNVLQMDICNYDNKSCDDNVDDQCLTYHNDVLNSEGSFTDIVNKLAERNPLQLTIYSHDHDGDDDGLIEFGEASVTLSGPTGFTDAVAHHFYESGRGPYSHAVDRTVDVTVGADDGGTSVVVGGVYVRLALTCHGPETRRGAAVAPISTTPDRPPLRPAPVGPSDCRRLGGPIVQPPPKMMYDDAAATCDETGTLGPAGHRRKSVVRKSSEETDGPRGHAEHACLCEELLKNVKRILFDGRRGRKDSAACDDRGAKTRPDAAFGKPHYRQPTAEKPDDRSV